MTPTVALSDDGCLEVASLAIGISGRSGMGSTFQVILAADPASAIGNSVSQKRA